MTQLTASQSIDLIQFNRDLFSQITSVNATYLTISVSIVVGSFIFITIIMYFLNYKPTKESLDKQTENIERIKEETELEVQNLKKSQEDVVTSLETFKRESRGILDDFKLNSNNSLENIQEFIKQTQENLENKLNLDLNLKFEEVNKKVIASEELAKNNITKLELSYKALDISSTWDMHYVWESQGVYVNVLSSIVSTLEKAQTYKQDGYIKLCLDVLPETIEKVIKNNPIIFDSLPNTILKLESYLRSIDNNDTKKQETISKIKILKEIIE